MAFKKIDDKIEWSEDFCKLCNICVEVCPIKNLEVKDNKIVSENKCSGCNICIEHCPDVALRRTNEKSTHKRK